MLKLRLSLAVLILGFTLLPGRAVAGKVGGTLARYALGGAGIGAVLGAAAATVPYLNDKQSFDFTVGAGAGAVAGVGCGLIFGIVDLLTDTAGDSEALIPARTEGLFATTLGPTSYLAWKTTF